jgi:hypothetical protein
MTMTPQARRAALRKSTAANSQAATGAATKQRQSRSRPASGGISAAVSGAAASVMNAKSTVEGLKKAKLKKQRASLKPVKVTAKKRPVKPKQAY